MSLGVDNWRIGIFLWYDGFVLSTTRRSLFFSFLSFYPSPSSYGRGVGYASKPSNTRNILKTEKHHDQIICSCDMPHTHSQLRGRGDRLIHEIQARATAPPSFSLQSTTCRFSPATRPVMAGVVQQQASQSLGHELSLVGVPAPTTLDGYSPASPTRSRPSCFPSG